MAISYVVDTYRGELEPASFSRFAVFQAFFPHLVAGPIVRASELLPQLERPRDPRRVDYVARVLPDPQRPLPEGGDREPPRDAHRRRGLRRTGQRTRRSRSWSAIYGYAVQIFADFCGYTNIAIGIALLLGFEFPQNFDSPYAAVSLQDFWRRWHMTLSRWLRDYLYIPLGGSRKGRLATYRNLMITMLLGGLWHGAAWTFVIWGGIHGVGLCVERCAIGVAARRRAARHLGRPDRHVPRRLLRVGVLPCGLARARRPGARSGCSRLGPAVAARDDVRRSLAIAVGIGGQYVRQGTLAAGHAPASDACRPSRRRSASPSG